MRAAHFRLPLRASEDCVSVQIVHYEASCERFLEAAAESVAHRSATHILAVHLSRHAHIIQRRNDRSYEGTFSRGDLTLAPAGARTYFLSDRAVDILTVGFSQAFVGAVTADTTGDTAATFEVPCIFRLDDPVCRELALSMLREAETEGPTARRYIQSAASVVVLRLARFAGRSVRPALRAALPAPVLQRVRNFLHSDMNRKPTLDELARVAGMSVHHFSRMFKRATGLAPHQYVNELRLERAKKLLAEGPKALAEVARETGFANPSQFSSFFRKRTSLTPSQFRRFLRSELSALS